MSVVTRAHVQTLPVAITINGVLYQREVEPRLLLSDFIRHELGLTGTHVGCEHGVCGCCTVLIDGRARLSCLTLALDAEGRRLTTVEGLKEGAQLHPLQKAFREASVVPDPPGQGPGEKYTGPVY